MYDRSFGSDVDMENRYVRTVVETSKSKKLGTVLKHFPGYGNNSDTHTGIAYDDRDYSEFENTDFKPFYQGIESGADCILVSHNIVNCMDSEYPASLSQKVHDILRNEFKFDGVIMTDDLIIRAITEMGFEEASPIQAQAIPVVLEGRDMIGQAQTGTGKTAAFGLPLLQKVDPKVKKLQAIVLLPTRELAIQVAEELRRFAKFMHGIKVLPVYGGQDIVRQIRALKDGTQIVVGTPGRVMDHMRRKTVKMDHVHTVVLDEADEMLNMGFLEDMETILSQLPEERQTLMFSATMPQAIADIAKKFQKDPVTVRVIKKELTVPKVTQYYYEVKPKNKVEVMCRLLDMYSPKLSIVFCNTKRQVDELVQALQGRGYFAEGLHGDLKQVQRDRVMESFRNEFLLMGISIKAA